MNDTSLIPYIVITSHPDYKRPYFKVCGNAVTCNKMEYRFLDIITNFMAEHIFEKCNNANIDSFSKFYDEYYSEFYMENEPIEIKYFMDDLWHLYKFNGSNLMEMYNSKIEKMENNKEEESSEEEKESSEEEKEETKEKKRIEKMEMKEGEYY